MDRADMPIRAADGTFFEIETEDETVLARIRSTCKDVRSSEASHCLVVLHPDGRMTSA